MDGNYSTLTVCVWRFEWKLRDKEFLRFAGNPKLGNLISLGHRELIYTFLGKGYVDAVAAHEESVVQYMKDYDASFRILEEPLMITGIGVAFAKEDDRGICEQMSQTLEEMRQDGTSLKIIEKYLDDPQKYLEVDDLGY